MSKMRRLFKGGDKGFTLIELLVVIAVLGILAAIAIPRLGGVTDQARMSEASSAMGSFKTALELFRVESTDDIPADDAEFQTVVERYVDNYDAGTYSGSLTWDVVYTNTNVTTPGSFNIVMEDSDDNYSVTMSYTTDSGYSDVVLEQQ